MKLETFFGLDAANVLVRYENPQQFQRFEQQTFEGALLINNLVRGEDNLSIVEEKEKTHNNKKIWVLHNE